MTDISFRESNGRGTTIKTGEVTPGVFVPGVQLYAKDPTGNIVPVTADVDGNFVISIGAVTVSNVEISNDVGNPVPVNGTVNNALGLIDVSPPLDTSAYASGDVLFVPVAVSFADANAGHGLLHSIVVIDTADQKQPLDLFFFSGPVPSFGAINTPLAIDDTDSLLYLHHESITAADYYDLGGASVARLTSIGATLKAATGSQAVYVAGVSRGTGAYAINSLKIRLGIAAKD